MSCKAAWELRIHGHFQHNGEVVKLQREESPLSSDSMATLEVISLGDEHRHESPPFTKRRKGNADSDGSGN